MEQPDLYLGVLEKDGFLRVDSKKLLLTKVAMEAGVSPESDLVEVTPEHAGKMALVSGVKSGEVIYSTTVMEILSPLTAILVKSLLNKGIITLEEISDQYLEPPPDDKEPEAKKKLCALVIGHKKRSPGAENKKLRITEFDFNEDLAMRIEEKVRITEIQRVYRRTYRELPGDINALGPDFVVSLHCNAFNGKASGTEVLYYHRSSTGKKVAGILQAHLVDFLKLPDRGIKPKTAEDRGGYLLRYTVAPCVIAEPFFIDNDDDLARAMADKEGLARAYAEAIDEISKNVG